MKTSLDPCDVALNSVNVLLNALVGYDTDENRIVSKKRVQGPCSKPGCKFDDLRLRASGSPSVLAGRPIFSRKIAFGPT